MRDGDRQHDDYPEEENRPVHGPPRRAGGGDHRQLAVVVEGVQRNHRPDEESDRRDDLDQGRQP
jgi:hypothetical protein